MIVMAAESISLISNDFVLEVSHLGLLSSLLDNVCNNANFKNEAIKYISDKNSHDLARICSENEVSESDKKTLQKFVSIYGERESVLQQLDDINEYVDCESINTLKTLSNMLDNLSSCKSPQGMLGALIRTYYAEKTGIDPKDICYASENRCNLTATSLFKTITPYESL